MQCCIFYNLKNALDWCAGSCSTRSTATMATERPWHARASESSTLWSKYASSFAMCACFPGRGYVTVVLVMQDDHEKAAEVYEKNCAKNSFGPSCFNLGRLL